MDQLTLSDEDRRRIALWAADCAERVLPLFEAKAPADTRPRKAVEGTEPSRAGASGQGNCAPLPGRRTQPHARSAIRLPQLPLVLRPTQRRPRTSTHWATPHQANHIHGPALYQAQARERAAGDDPGVGDEEIRWAIEHASPAHREVVRS